MRFSQQDALSVSDQLYPISDLMLSPQKQNPKAQQELDLQLLMPPLLVMTVHDLGYSVFPKSAKALPL
jgi:hypothetical protein